MKRAAIDALSKTTGFFSDNFVGAKAPICSLFIKASGHGFALLDEQDATQRSATATMYGEKAQFSYGSGA